MKNSFNLARSLRSEETSPADRIVVTRFWRPAPASGDAMVVRLATLLDAAGARSSHLPTT